MKTYVTHESREIVVPLTDAEAIALANEGRRLASDSAWWGSADGETNPERTVISVSPRGKEQYAVRVSDAIGLVSTGATQLEVRPKIAPSHALYLLSHSDALPRIDETRAAAAEHTGLWELVARWYLREMELVLRHDLVRDYCEVARDEKIVRGRVNPLQSAYYYYSGRLEFACEYEDFSTDTPLNRTLRAAARVVSASPTLPWPDRRRALSIISRMDEVGDLRIGDTRVKTTRRTAHCADAQLLARHILWGRDRSPNAGDALAWSFLIRTPEAIEQGLRRLLAERLPSTHVLTKKAIRLSGSPLTFNPDLVFNSGASVGDVKYKLAQPEWRRSDLYQVVAFATAYRADRGCMIDFSRNEEPTLPALVVGDLSVRHFSWRAVASVAPSEAADELAAAVTTWLNESTPLSQVG